MKIKALMISLLILVGVFVLGFLGINLGLRIVVGHGNEVMVPDLTGMHFDVAAKKCTDLKLYLQETEAVHSDEIPKGRIISQEPHPDIHTKRFRTVHVTVSKGPELIRIPFVENLTVVQAKLKLENAGLQLGKKIQRYSSDVKKGYVIGSQPSADELIPRKSEIDVIVSLGDYSSLDDNGDKWRTLLDEGGK
jgi:serine/threonine-protein kinase